MKAQGSGARALVILLLSAFAGCALTPEPANLEQTRATSANTPLMQAITEGDLQRVKTLVENGAALNTLTGLGTPLALAVSSDEEHIIWYLLSQGAAPDLTDEQRHTPLMTAAAGGDRRVVQLLLAAGARVNAASATGETPVSLAARAGNLSVVKTLLGAGANVNVSQGGRSVLMQVVDGGDLLTAEALLAAGAEVNFTDSRGITALDLARTRNNRDLEMLLIQAGADT